ALLQTLRDKLTNVRRESAEIDDPHHKRRFVIGMLSDLIVNGREGHPLRLVTTKNLGGGGVEAIYLGLAGHADDQRDVIERAIRNQLIQKTQTLLGEGCTGR